MKRKWIRLSQEYKAALRKGAVQRRALEDALKKNEGHYAKLVEESKDLQQCLQNLTRHILTEHEDERTTISRKLHNDIAQILLGIQVRLAALKKEAALHTTDFKKEIGRTQRLVNKSAKTLDRFAGTFGP